MGYEVRLILTQHVKALCKNQKNDANDALAICETACRPGIYFVPIKTIEQQDIKALRSAQQLAVEQRTVLENQIRAFSKSDKLRRGSKARLCYRPSVNIFITNKAVSRFNSTE